jgi:hypothetical protein
MFSLWFVARSLIVFGLSLSAFKSQGKCLGWQGKVAIIVRNGCILKKIERDFSVV